MRSKKIMIGRSILNRRKRGFTAQDIYLDADADMSYVLKGIRAQVAAGTLVETRVDDNGRKHYKLAPVVKKTNKVVAPTEPLWVSLVKQRITHFGRGGSAAVAKELEVSPATISGINTGNYPAKTTDLEARVLAKYVNEVVDCPKLGEIKREVCMQKLSTAQAVGVKGPAHLRKIRAACLQCKGGGIHKSGCEKKMLVKLKEASLLPTFNDAA